MDALYQKQILLLAKHARTSNLDLGAPLQANIENPICGDRVNVSFYLKSNLVHALGVKVRGCALCEAGAGLMLKSFECAKVTDVRLLTSNFSDWISKLHNNPLDPEMLPFTPVREIKNRHQCVLLAFQAMRKIIDEL